MSKSALGKWCKKVRFLVKAARFGVDIVPIALCEKCPNTEFFLVRIFPYPVRIRENTDQKNLRIWTLFTQCSLQL